MMVKELIKKLKEMNPNAEVFATDLNGYYLKVFNCKEENSEEVSLELKRRKKYYAD